MFSISIEHIILALGENDLNAQYLGVIRIF